VPPEDSRIWNGRLEDGHADEHERFVGWLNSADAQEVFRRRRLTEYTLAQDGDKLMVTFKAPHTGDPRIMIDFLRYPGLWPEYWLFENSDMQAPSGSVRVHWRRPEQD
jgi:hypothetical protein